MPTYTSLHRAAKLHEKIEELRGQLADLLDKARAELAASSTEEVPSAPRRGRRKMLKKSAADRRASLAPLPRGRKPAKVASRTVAVPATKKRRQSPLKGVKRSTSPSGPLAPAVVKVLETKKQPMKVQAILDGLLADGYHFNSTEPKKNLAARIYRLKGVRQVAAGLFGLA